MKQTAKGNFDLTKGKILDRLLLVALPIMGTQLMQMAYNLTDMFWLGRVSSDAVAASGTAGMYMWLSAAFLFLGRTGAEIGVSQNLGKGKADLARAYAQNALLLSAVSGVLFGACMIIFRHPLIGFFHIQEAHVAADAAIYLAVAAIGIPMSFVSGAITGAFNGSGNSRLPFYINAVGLVVNVILDPILIMSAGWGIMGAAAATSIAQALVCALFLVAVKKSAGRPFSHFTFFSKADLNILKQIFRWALPVGLESLLFTVLSMFISRFVAAFGSDAIAVQRVGSQIESLTWLIGGGFGSALTAFFGQNYGAGKWSRIHRGFKLATVAMIGWGIFVTLLLFFLASPLFRIFLPAPDIVAAGTVYLRILSSCQILACLEAVAAGCFRGIGKTVPPSVVSIVGNALRVPLAYFLSTTSLGITGIWWGVAIGASARGIWVFIWYLVDSRKMPQEDEPIASGQVQLI